MMKSNHLAYAVLAALLSIQTLPASAANADTASAVEASGQEAQQASDSIANYVDDQIVQGPATVDLGNQAKLKLPAKMIFVKKNRAEFYYVKPGKYYLRCFFDHNGDGKWTTGSISPRRDPEEVYYYPKVIETRANWDTNETWDVTAVRLDKQKPAALIKQRKDKQRNDSHQRNLERLRQRGE